MLVHSQLGASAIAAVLVIAAGGLKVVRGDPIGRVQRFLILVAVGIFLVTWLI